MIAANSDSPLLSARIRIVFDHAFHKLAALPNTSMFLSSLVHGYLHTILGLLDCVASYSLEGNEISAAW